MRKWIGWLLLLVGAFLLTTALLALVWAPDNIKRTPLSTDSYTYLTGEADKLNPANGEVENVPVAVLSRTKVDDDKSDGDVVVFLNTTCANIDEEDPADCLEDDDPRLISNGIDVFATDRRTAEAINDPDYLPSSAKAHEGLVNKFPFDVEKKTYDFYDGILGRAVPAEYVGIKDVDGLETYEFHIEVTDEPAEVLSGVDGIYSMDKTVWIAPATGSIVDQEQHEVRQQEDGSTLLDMRLSFTDETVEGNVADGKSSTRLLSALGGLVPLLSGILGLLAMAGGAFLVARRRSTEE